MVAFAMCDFGGLMTIGKSIFDERRALEVVAQVEPLAHCPSLSPFFNRWRDLKKDKKSVSVPSSY